MQEIAEKWHEQYPYAMKSWEINWDVISPSLSFLQMYEKSFIQQML